MIIGTEECDDNNTVDGDGCDSQCIIESAHYCEINSGNFSNCSTCSTGCLNCTSNSNCSLCDTLYTLNGT